MGGIMRRSRWNKFIFGMVFWTLTYPFGILLGVLFHLLRILKILRIRNLEYFPYFQKKLVLVSNHASLWDPIILVGLFFKQYFFHPIRFCPWSTPDKGNYFDKWYWFFARPRFIPVPREEVHRVRTVMRSLVKIIRVLRNGGIVIFFPEGGRTFKGKTFLFSKKKKKVLRTLRSGIGDIVCKTNATVVPVWIEGAENVLPNNGAIIPRLWRKVTITIGKSMDYNHGAVLERKQITQEVSDALLQLADED